MKTADLKLDSLLPLLEKAFQFRQPLLYESGAVQALRLFNGFWEGWPGLAVDLYGRTLVMHGYAEDHAENLAAAQTALGYLLPAMSGRTRCVILKYRGASDPELRRGQLLFGENPDQKVSDQGVWYALDLRLHQDATLYLDTRELRKWAQHNLAGARVLNTFAYTGSLGAAAMAGGAQQVIQTDLTWEYLNVARQTYRLNGWQVQPRDFITGNFFSVIARLKRQQALFDCVFLDPPFFSTTRNGRVDLNEEYDRLVNKVRPLIGHGGRLVTVYNALFVSGQGFLAQLEALTNSGYLEIETLIPAPVDFTGFNALPLQPLPADPSPFNYSTKIAVLKVKRKDQRS